MDRLVGGGGGLKTATLILCIFNLIVALYLSYVVLLPLFFSLSDGGLVSWGSNEGEAVAGDAGSSWERYIGKPAPECNYSPMMDYDGSAVKWGLDFFVNSAAECCEACLASARSNDTSLPRGQRCNTWVYCPNPAGCFAPDIYDHQFRECWLKFSETPKVNNEGKYSEEFRKTHPTSPEAVQWVAGRLSADAA